MKKNRRLLLIIALIFGVAVYSISVIRVNIDAQPYISQLKTHKIGETIDIQANYFDTISENPDGYLITVKSARLLTYSEFVSEHPEVAWVESDNEIEYIYDVEVSFNNQFNTVGYINLARYNIQATTEQVYLDFNLMGLLEPKLGSFPAFKVKLGTEKTYHLPFVANLYTEQLSGAYLRGKDVQLAVSQYPVKHVVPLLFE